MKYLMKFNESLSFHVKNFSKRSEIKEFSNNYLSYFLDDGFNLKVKEEYASYDITISTNISRPRKIKTSRYEIWSKSFEWSDVSDYLIPYLIMLKKTYDVRTQIFFHTVWTSKYVTYNRVLNDSYEKPTEITNIIIRIKK